MSPQLMSGRILSLPCVSLDESIGIRRRNGARGIEEIDLFLCQLPTHAPEVLFELVERARAENGHDQVRSPEEEVESHLGAGFSPFSGDLFEAADDAPGKIALPLHRLIVPPLAPPCSALLVGRLPFSVLAGKPSACKGSTLEDGLMIVLSRDLPKDIIQMLKPIPVTN
jgi:hypothetical protein